MQSSEQTRCRNSGRRGLHRPGQQMGKSVQDRGRDGDRTAVIARHEAWLRDQHELLRSIGELRGKDLVCFCAPAPCHGDLLLRLANGSRDEMVAWWRSPRP